MQTNRRRFATAGVTTFVLLLSIFIVAWGPPAQGAHIPATGPLPSNCVEFQVDTLGTKSPSAFPDVDITVNSWTGGSDAHSLSFTISGLADGQYVDASVKSGTTVQEPGPYGNGTHTFANGLQNAISHIRFCVFVTTTTPPLSRLRPPLSRLRPPLSRLRPPLSRLRPPLSRLRPPLSRLRPPLSRLRPRLIQGRAPPQPIRARLRPPLIRARPRPRSVTRSWAPRSRRRLPPSPIRGRSPTRSSGRPSWLENCPSPASTPPCSASWP